MKKIQKIITEVYHFIVHDVWRLTEHEISKKKRLPYRLIKIIVISLRGIVQDHLAVRASALTYSILFAMVPLIALFIAIGKGFGVENIIKEWLQDTLIAQKELIPIIMEFVERYLETTQGGFFIGIGIFVLLISIMNFFKQAENTFNSIWEVKKSRSVLRQFTTYFSALFIIPLLVVFSGGLGIYFNTLIYDLQLQQLLSPLLKFGMKLTPYFISWLLFTIMYIVIPNTRVKFSSGLVAGVIAGTAFQAFQNFYIWGQVYLTRYDMVYGSFAAIPLLLLWLQISCLIVLLGAEISYATQNSQNYDFEGDTKNISQRYKQFLTMFLTYVIVKRFENNQPPIRNDEFATVYKLPIRLVNQLLSELNDIGIITEILDDDMRTKSYQPAMDINRISVQLLMEKLESKGAELFLSNKNPMLDDFWKKHQKLSLQTAEGQPELLIKDI